MEFDYLNSFGREPSKIMGYGPGNLKSNNLKYWWEQCLKHYDNKTTRLQCYTETKCGVDTTLLSTEEKKTP